VALPGVQREGDPQHLRIEENQGEAMAPAEREVMQMALETAEQIASADYRHWEELASLGEFERWARSRANHIADALRAALAQPQPAECDGGQCGIGGYCKKCPKTQPDVPETAFGKTEPVAWTVQGLISDFSRDFSAYQTKTYTVPLYTAPPAKEWVGLTDDEYELMAEKRVTNYFFNTLDYAHDIEAMLKEKNT
jgi:hypothetical protein